MDFTIPPDTRSDTEIKQRIALSNNTFTKIKSIFTNRNIKVYTKLNTLKAYIWSIVLYGCECWTLTKDLEIRLEVAEMWYIRRIMRISWTEKKSNEEIMEMAGYKRSPLKTIRKRQLQFFWHINRADEIEKTNIKCKDLWYEKQRKTTHKIHRESQKFRNKKRISQQ